MKNATIYLYENNFYNIRSENAILELNAIVKFATWYNNFDVIANFNFSIYVHAYQFQ